MQALSSGAMFLSGGRNHTCAALIDNVYCWGLNDEGQLGIGRSGDSVVPTIVDLLSAGNLCVYMCFSLD
jgi:alpha-tubulin suppressor-like RCC1 family protein